MSEFLGSDNPSTISIGQNMTSLLCLARALSRKFNSGDEVVITELDHEANRGPWMVLEKAGVKLVEIKSYKMAVLIMRILKVKSMRKQSWSVWGCRQMHLVH